MKFAVIGCGGYIARRHLQAIKDIGGELVCACDVNDSVGILDSFNYNAKFFTDINRFFDYAMDYAVDYLSICTPNHLHSAHIFRALGCGMKAICEKPMVITRDQVEDMENTKNVQGNVFPIFQLRYSPVIERLREFRAGQSHIVGELSYCTPRGDWYLKSWKGDRGKSGGLLHAIGVHFIDLLDLVFGPLKSMMKVEEHETASILLGDDNGDVTITCNLSINKDRKPLRRLVLNGIEFDLGENFTGLHTRCYEEILAGRGIPTREALRSAKILLGMA